MDFVQKALLFSSKDSDIVDLQQFERFLNSSRSEDSRQKMVSLLGSESQIRTFSQTGGSIRGAVSRPGFTTSLQNEQLKNNPNESETNYEVFRTDVVPLSTYRKMSRDPDLAIGSYLYSGMMASLNYSISCEDRQVEAVIAHAYEGSHSEIVRNMVSSGVENGFCFGEKAYIRETVNLTEKNADGEDETIYSGAIVSLKRIKFMDPDQDFQYFQNQDDEIAYVIQQQTNGQKTVRRNKLLWFALDQRFTNPFGRSRYKNAYESWYYSKIGYQYMLMHLEKNGSPHIEARFPQGKTRVNGEIKDNDEVIQDLAFDLRSYGIATMPSERDEKGNLLWEIKYVEAKNSDPDPYLKYLQHELKRKYRALGIPPSILVQSQNSDSDAKSDFFLVMYEDLVQQIEDVIQKDVIDYLVDFNFGLDRVPPVKFTIDRSGLGRRRMLKEILINQQRLDYSVAGYRPKQVVSTSKAASELGLETAAFEEAYESQEGFGKEPNNVADKVQRQEDTNGRNRATPDNRDRERKAKRNNVTDTV